MKEIKFYQSVQRQTRRLQIRPWVWWLVVTLVAFGGGVTAERSGWINELTRQPDNPTNQSLPEDLDYSSVEKVYDLLRRQYDGELTAEALLDGLKAGLAQATGDPYTVYLSPEQAQEFEAELNGTFSGIGAEVGKRDGSLVIIAPLDGYPAEKAGLLAKDKIIAIDGEDTSGLLIEDAITKIRGPEGTTVKLTILRGQTRKEFSIERQTITLPSVKSEMKNHNIGYIQISRFADDTVDLTRQAAQELKDQGAMAVVLDLRNNSGGLLSAAVGVSSVWLNKDIVVTQRQGDVVTDTLKAGNSAILDGLPTIVLINSGSASASEIVAGALKDNEAARLLGETSFGKGSVQQLEDLDNGGELKVTIARWYTPAGQNIDKTGIKPDIKVKLTEQNAQADIDTQLNAALKLLAQ